MKGGKKVLRQVTRTQLVSPADTATLVQNEVLDTITAGQNEEPE